MFAKAIEKVDNEKSDNNRASTMIAGGGLALGGMVPGLSGVSHLAAHGAVAVASGMAASLMNKDVLNTHDVMEHINGKRVAGETITAADIVTLRISQNEDLQREIKKVNGTAFHKMNEAQQKAVIVGMPAMEDAQAFADRINGGLITEQDVLMAGQAKPNWAAKVGGPRAAQGSFVEQQRARAAASAAQGFAAGV